MELRNTPDFPHDAQKRLWVTRRELARLSGFPFKETIEQGFIRTLSVEDAIVAVAEAEADLTDFKTAAVKKSRRGKKPAVPHETNTGGSGGGGGGGGGGTAPPKGDDDEGEEDAPHPEDPVNESASDAGGGGGGGGADEPDPSDSDDSDESDDDRRRTSPRDRERIRGRTPRVEVGGHGKLFKM